MICDEPRVNLRLAQDLDAVTDLVARGPCVRAAAKTPSGSSCAIDHPGAYYYCPQGAALLFTRNVPDGNLRYHDIMDALHYELGPYTSVAVWADRHSHAEVVGPCRRAATRARGLE
jgi:hypothetical protein